jgi:hypothetical protein
MLNLVAIDGRPVLPLHTDVQHALLVLVNSDRVRKEELNRIIEYMVEHRVDLQVVVLIPIRAHVLGEDLLQAIHAAQSSHDFNLLDVKVTLWERRADARVARRLMIQQFPKLKLNELDEIAVK